MTQRPAFRTAKRKQVYLRVFLLAMSGYGKSYTGMTLAMHLARLMGLPPNKVGVIDTEVTEDEGEEQGSVEKYEGEHCRCAQCMGTSDLVFEGWQTLCLPPSMRQPQDYTWAVAQARQAGIKVLLVDSMSHEWDGALALKEEIEATTRANSWTAWREVTAQHSAFLAALQTYPGHVICTIRGKEKHEQTEDKKIRSLGILPVQRPGIEYEFDLGFHLYAPGRGVMVKSRAAALHGRGYDKPGLALAQDMLHWATRGNAMEEREAARQQEVQQLAALNPRELKRQLEGVRDQAKRWKLDNLHQQVEQLLGRANMDPAKLAQALDWAKGHLTHQIDLLQQKAKQQGQALAAVNERVDQALAQHPDPTQAGLQASTPGGPPPSAPSTTMDPPPAADAAAPTEAAPERQAAADAPPTPQADPTPPAEPPAAAPGPPAAAMHGAGDQFPGSDFGEFAPPV